MAHPKSLQQNKEEEKGLFNLFGGESGNIKWKRQNQCCHLLLFSFFFSFFFLFLWESFNLWRSLLMIFLYYQTKTPISFWCSRGLNYKSLIQALETLPVKLDRTHKQNIQRSFLANVVIWLSNFNFFFFCSIIWLSMLFIRGFSPLSTGLLYSSKIPLLMKGNFFYK